MVCSMTARLDLEKVTFAVIDDNSNMRHLVRTLIISFGARMVYEAEDGASGLEIIESYGPDIVVTDWVMPLIDGLEMTKLIRNPDGFKFPYTPIIMLTGHSEHRRVIQARNAGITEFLCKPVSAQALYTRIQTIILHPRPFVRSASYFGPERRRLPSEADLDSRRQKDDVFELERTADLG